MVFPILIPSKNRPDKKLFSILAGEQLDFKIIVEPQDQAKYEAWDKHLLILPENNRGVSYARNYCLQYARKYLSDWFWMIDDDLTKFCHFNPNEKKVTTKQALELSESLFLPLDNIAQASLEYRQYAWGHNIPLKFNSYCNACVCLNIVKTKLFNYKESLKMKEDKDFSLQILTSGYRNVRTAQIAFQTPNIGSNPGGCHEIYKPNIEKAESLKLCKIWGETLCTPQIKRDGRNDVKVNWSYFKNN